MSRIKLLHERTLKEEEKKNNVLEFQYVKTIVTVNFSGIF